MKRKYDIFFGTFVFVLAFACACLQSCRQTDSEMIVSDGVASLIERGQYLAARNAEAIAALEDPDKSSWFEKDTPYRLLAFTRPYDASDCDNAANVLADHLRFNTVAWEGETPQHLHFINIAGDPDKMFGFSALDGETGDTNGRVSLDFYGFTYGKPLADRTDDYDKYAELDNDDPSQPLASLYRKESINDNSDGTLNDLYRGVLLNQNIETAGKYSSTATQSIMPYKHCFSKLRFMVVQQEAEEPDADGNPQLSFKDLQVDAIEVTGTYGEGKVFLQDGKVELVGGKIDRTLQFRDSFTADTYNRKVTLNQVDVGEMIVFPSHGDALKESNNLPDGYSLGLKITVRSHFKHHIESFLANTGSTGSVTESTDTDANGKPYYTGTIVKENIIDSYYDTPLKFRQNTAYTLVISFQRDAVRIITVIPQVEEWLNGEGTPDKPWQDQAIGQPQMFDNVVWSDRNLGADHYDPAAVVDGQSGFEMSSGYFYQAGRNIPYYPFDPANWTATGGIPDYDIINRQNLRDKDTDWGSSPYKLFPIVDSEILRLITNKDGTLGNWIMSYDKEKSQFPQMKIPEEKPTDAYFNFMNNGGLNGYDMQWNLGQENQPVSGMWVVPSREDFLTIFPSTPHAGNIVLNKGGNNTNPMDWGVDGKKYPNFRITGTKTLRVTVPYYTAGMKESEIVSNDKKNNKDYCDAWKTLHDFVDEDGNKDPGTTHIDEYTNGKPGEWHNVNCEPNGDPEDGYASVYVISIDGEENETSLTNDDLKNRLIVKSWGTIYAIKRVYTSEAYRMRWRVLIADEGIGDKDIKSPSLYVEICRYRCGQDDMLTEDNYMDYDWKHPAARLYFPICGLGDHTGQYINYGMECQYATSEPIKDDGTTSAVQIKITGNNASNAYIAVVNGHINRHFGMQIRPVRGGQK